MDEREEFTRLIDEKRFELIKDPSELGDLSQLEQRCPQKAFRYQCDGPLYEGEYLPREIEQLGQELAILISNQDVGKAGAKPSGAIETLRKHKKINPRVGAVLIRAEKGSTHYDMVGCCRGAFDGDNHAEFSLLNIGLKQNHLTEDDYFFTTLEPCTKNSRNAWSRACSVILEDRGVKNIYIGMMDPNPLITGYGYFYLFKHIKDVEVRPFFSGYRNIIATLNKEYRGQFKLPDFETYRNIWLSLEKYIDLDAVNRYIRLVLGEEPSADSLIHFFKAMVMRRYLFKQKAGDIEIFTPSDEFALFFFKNPSSVVDGATVIVAAPQEIKVPDEFSEGLIDRPLATFFDSGQGSFAHLLIAVYGTNEDKTAAEKPGAELKDILERVSKRIKLNPFAIREAITNALVHRDYASGTFIKITLLEDEITIANPVKGYDFEDWNSLLNFSKPSNPANPKLMRLFMDIDQTERKGLGLSNLQEEQAFFVPNGRNEVVLHIPIGKRLGK